MANIVKGIPLGGGQQARFGNTTVNTANSSQQLVNIIPVTYVDDLSGAKYTRVYSRPGFNSFIVAPISGYKITRGMIWTGVPASTLAANGVLIYAEHNGTDVRLYKWDSSATLLGTFASAYECIGIQETILSGVANLTLNVRLIASAYTQKALFFPNGGALTEITDGDFPTNTIGKFAHLDGYAFIMDVNGNIWNSDINSISAWTANSYIATSGQPDAGVGVAKIKNLIVGFGTNSIDFFENAGNATGSPLSRIPQASISIGALHSGDILPVGDDIFFVGRSAPGKFGVYMLSGFQAKKISTPFIDAILRNLLVAKTVDTPVRGGSYAVVQNGSHLIGSAVLHGQTVVFLASGLNGTEAAVAPIIYAYYVESDVWGQLVFGGSPTTIPQAIFGSGASTFCALPVEGISASFTTVTSDLVTDSIGGSNAQFDWMIRTHKITHGTGNRKFCKQVRLIGAIQIGTCSIRIRYSDDGGNNYTTLATLDSTIAAPKATRGGSYRERIWELSSGGAASPCDLDRMEETFEVGDA